MFRILQASKRINKKFKISSITGLVAVVIFFMPVYAGAHNENAVATVSQIKKSVVAIGTTKPRRSPQHIIRGTGFVIRDGRHVVTNGHVVVAPLDRINRERLVVFVTNHEELEIRQVEIVMTLPVFDLVLLKLLDGEPLMPVKIGASSEVMEGQPFYFTGYRLGAIFSLQPATHHALLASISPIIIPVNNAKHLNTRSINQLRQPWDIFELDALAYSGASGSPLYDPATGQVIGIINMSLMNNVNERNIDNIGRRVYAVPSKYINKLFH